MARKVYMVDTENVSSSWRMMLADMTRNDVLYLFYTEHSPGIGYADFKEIIESEMKPELISCYPGKNGLDFQLVSYLGYLLKSAGKTEYIIISNDMGYDCVIHFWKEQGYKVSRMTVYDLIQRKKTRLAQEKKETDSAAKEQPLESAAKDQNLENTVKEQHLKNTVKKQSLENTVKEQPIGNAVKEQLLEKDADKAGLEIEIDSAKEQKKTTEEQIPDIQEQPPELISLKEKEPSGKRGRKKKQPEEEAASSSETIVITKTEQENETKEENKDKDENEDGRKLLANLLAAHDVDVDTVIEILRHGSPHQLQKVYTQMLKLFGHQTGVELYHVLKPHFPALFTYAKSGLEHGMDI